MASGFPYPLVPTQWLAGDLGAPDLRVIDASWRMPGNPPAIEDHRRRRIPGAVHFDLDLIADRTSDLPHMLPSPAQFAAAVGALGVAADDRVVIYDDAGIFSAPRVWWTFRAMGHERVSVLDGGLPKWLREGRPVESGEASPAAVSYRLGRLRPLARTHHDVRAALAARSAAVIDARPAARFGASAPEPRPGLRRGAMPGARNLPYTEMIAADGTLKPLAELRALFAAAGAAPGAEVIATCGSGVTAAALALALEAIGAPAVGLYDGSWAEWGREANEPAMFPVEPPA
ncbi:MAG: 3-mercaptopyruvate sulfurtransferase [Parvularculaceae bacterium]